jgi:DNA-binding MarR family transcriptional regulator
MTAVALNRREAQMLDLMLRSPWAWASLTDLAALTDESSPAVFASAATSLEARGYVEVARFYRAGEHAAPVARRRLYRLTAAGRALDVREAIA